MAYSKVGKIVEDIRGEALPEPRDPWETSNRPSPAACVLYGIEMRAKAIAERRLINRIKRWWRRNA